MNEPSKAFARSRTFVAVRRCARGICPPVRAAGVLHAVLAFDDQQFRFATVAAVGKPGPMVAELAGGILPDRRVAGRPR